MISYFPKIIANKGITLYLIALGMVLLLFYHHPMPWYFYAIGISFIALFFLGSSTYSKKWEKLPDKKYKKKLFITALIIRVVWVIISYYFYFWATGTHFEFGVGDAMGYHETAWDQSERTWKRIFKDYSESSGYSDLGYVTYLTLVYKIFGVNIIIARLLKAVWSALSAVLLYKLAARNIGEKGGRLAGVFACFMPNLIMYCGLHLKETEMIFIIIAFLERSDYMLRCKKFKITNVILPILLGASLFTFRTVLGVTVFFSLITALAVTQQKIVGKGKRVILIAWCALAIAVLAGGKLIQEVEKYWDLQFSNEDIKRNYQASKGVEWAKYATGTVMAPMIFILPFPTMIDATEQYNQNMMHSGNFVRNFMGGFVLLALYISIFKKKNWRNLSLIGSYAICYLGIISLSGYANAERFLLPGLPALLILAAYGITQLDGKGYSFIKKWYYVVPVMSVAWAFFKLGARGMF